MSRTCLVFLGTNTNTLVTFYVFAPNYGKRSVHKALKNHSAFFFVFSQAQLTRFPPTVSAPKLAHDPHTHRRCESEELTSGPVPISLGVRVCVPTPTPTREVPATPK